VLCRAIGNGYSLSFVLKNLSEVALALRDYGRAAKLLIESLKLGCQLGSREGISCALLGLASMAAARIQPKRAGRLLGAAEALQETIGTSLAEAERATYGPYLALARDELDGAVWAATLAEGRALSLDEALAYALEDESEQPLVTISAEASSHVLD